MSGAVRALGSDKPDDRADARPLPAHVAESGLPPPTLSRKREREKDRTRLRHWVSGPLAPRSGSVERVRVRGPATAQPSFRFLRMRALGSSVFGTKGRPVTSSHTWM